MTDKNPLYREKTTNILYEGQVFNDAAMVRQKGGRAIEMLSIVEFKERFDESWVNY